VRQTRFSSDTLFGTEGVLACFHSSLCLFESVERPIPIQVSFVSIEFIPTGIYKCNKKILIATIRDPDLFRVEK
jgi:hypothetical protein